MPLTVALTPGYTVTPGEDITEDILNELANPTIALQGSIDQQSITVGAVNQTNLSPAPFFYGNATLSGSTISFNANGVPSPAPGAYAAGTTYCFLPNFACPSGGVSVNVNGIGSENLYKAVNVPLAANDFLSGQLVWIQFDGVNFQLVNVAPSGLVVVGPTAGLTATAATTSFTNTAISETSNVVTVTTSAAHGLSAGDVVTIAGALPVGYNGTFTIASVGTDTYTYSLLTSPGSATAYGTTVGSIASSIGFSASQLQLTNANGNTLTLTSGATVTGVNFATSGAGGLDTGSVADSTWYYLWAIYNGSAVAGLLSLSSTAPTLPSGYTYTALVCPVRTDASAKMVAQFSTGRKVFFMPMTAFDGDVTTAYTFQSVTVATWIPPGAATVLGTMGIIGTTPASMELAVAGDAAGTGAQYSAAAIISSAFFDGFNTADNFEVPVLSAQTLYFKASSASQAALVKISGYTF